MNKIFKNTFQIFQVLIVILMILLSGSAMFVISSFFNDNHDCCCKNSTSHQTEESLQCNKACCEIIEAKEQPLESSTPVSGNKTEKTFFGNYDFPETGISHISASTIIFNPYNNKPQKIFLITSVIRI